jgi:hypothetical protein
MKKIHLAPYCFILTVVNCTLPQFLGKLAAFMRVDYNNRGLKFIPVATETALASPMWFYVFTIFCVLASAAIFCRKIPVFIIVHCLLIICILEGLALFFFASSLDLPFFAIGR